MPRLQEAPAIDVIVIGAGVNGLVCATLLAQARRRVLVVEALGRPGGACATSEVVAGHRVSTIAHLLGPLDPVAMKALKLQRFGLQFSARQIGTVALSPTGRHVVLGGDLRHTSQSLALWSQADAKAWPLFDGRMRKAAQQLERWVRSAPAAQTGGAVSSRATTKSQPALDEETADFLDASIAEALDAAFETPLIKGALAFDAVLGSAMSPRAPGTALATAIRRALGGDVADGVVHPKGGAGAFSGALIVAAESAGVCIRTNARVANLVFDAERIAGVELEGGEALRAPVVVSSLDPKSTLLGLGTGRRLPLGMKRRLEAFSGEGCVAKVNLALAGLPAFKGLDRNLLRERLVICPGIDELDNAFAAYEQGVLPSAPAVELAIPSLHDPSLAVAGQHVMSLNVLYVPKNLSSGSWESGRQDLMAALGSVLRAYAPDLPDMILGADLFTPSDIEQHAGSPGGHWHGCDLSLDRLGPLRPLEGLSRYATPLAGLFLCGAATHPAGGVTCVNGRLAAEAVLAAGEAQ